MTTQVGKLMLTVENKGYKAELSASGKSNSSNRMRTISYIFFLYCRSQNSLIMKSVCFVSAFFLFASCTAPNKLVKFSKSPDDVYTNSNLKSFLKNNPQTNIVLRIPNANENVTSKNSTDKTITSAPSMDVYYNDIEKEFLKAGFSVRDRGLFNEVLGKMSRDNNGNINYSQIKDLTNTDLIVEVIKINPSVPYVTNKSYTVGKKEKITESTSNREFKKFGASAEFKIIMVKNNEMAGTYTFNYNPCQDGCPVSSFAKPPLVIKTRLAPPVPAYEGMEPNEMEDFIKHCARDLITAMKS